MMDKALLKLLREIERKGRANDAREADRARKMLNLEPGTAQLVSILLRSSGARHVLEIGTSNGYSTIWLAWSLVENIAARNSRRRPRRRGGPRQKSEDREPAPILTQETDDARIISIDRSPDKHALARENLRRAGFAARVDLRTGDATAIVTELLRPLRFRIFRRRPRERSGATAIAAASAGRESAAAARQRPVASRRNRVIPRAGGKPAGVSAHGGAGGQRPEHRLSRLKPRTSQEVRAPRGAMVLVA